MTYVLMTGELRELEIGAVVARRLQASPATAQVGVLTDSSYVQLTGQGVACIDVGFPCRYTHSANEVCDRSDLDGLTRLIDAALGRIGPGFRLERD